MLVAGEKSPITLNCTREHWQQSQRMRRSISQDTSRIGATGTPSGKETSCDCGNRHHRQRRSEGPRVARADIVEKLSEESRQCKPCGGSKEHAACS